MKTHSQSLNHSNRKRIALIVETSLSSGREILRGVAKYAHQINNWEIFHAPHALGDNLPNWLNDWQGDGIIARIESSEKLSALQNFNIPVVDVLGLVLNSDFPLVHVDDAAIAKAVADHFLRRDFRHFGFYGFVGENWSERRREAFRENCSDAQSFHDYSTSRNTDESTAQARASLEAWITSLPRPIGIMVCTDQCGLAVLEACRSLKVPVPEQIAVVGVDNDLPLCEIGSPALTSIRAGHFPVGYKAAKLLDSIIGGGGGEPPPNRILVPPTGIVTRGSSDTHAINDSAVAVSVNFIHQNLANPLSNDLIARSAGVSRTTFQKRFLNEMGVTIRDYLIKQRLARARKLITESDFTLADIAERCGFKHQEYLGSVFKAHFGITPGGLRKKNLKKDG